MFSVNIMVLQIHHPQLQALKPLLLAKQFQEAQKQRKVCLWHDTHHQTNLTAWRCFCNFLLLFLDWVAFQSLFTPVVHNRLCQIYSCYSSFLVPCVWNHDKNVSHCDISVLGACGRFDSCLDWDWNGCSSTHCHCNCCGSHHQCSMQEKVGGHFFLYKCWYIGMHIWSHLSCNWICEQNLSGGEFQIQQEILTVADTMRLWTQQMLMATQNQCPLPILKETLNSDSMLPGKVSLCIRKLITDCLVSWFGWLIAVLWIRINLTTSMYQQSLYADLWVLV